ncbi:hypothetical protein EXN66_Car012410 [Channa argus]|uniref:Podoplanin n=1 Tax=Channa argus TaxID=215402 RepID=A0A6G1Q2J8_CHAAH|nr:hypothetical protein EXN66_Car012410 [Channa argus]KAK2897799.1 hypothetical protein Q8A73_014179 [Channa argus]
MNVQLLLLLALVGPFCAFTHASPTMLTTIRETATSDIAQGTSEATHFTHASTTEETMAPRGHTPTVSDIDATTNNPTDANTDTTTVAPTDDPRDAPTSTTQSKFLITPPPVVTDKVSTEPGTTYMIDTDIEAETAKGVVVEETVQEGLSSGQIVGIVIGALLAVVIVIAVVIAVVKRMGKYSP